MDAELFRATTDRTGCTPLEWAARPLTAAERVLAIGPAAVPALLPAGWITLAGPRPTLRADPTALPLRRNAVDGLGLLLVLAATVDLDGLFAEVRRVLRPGGTLVVLTPSAAVRAPSELGLRAVHRRGWANRAALDRAGWILAAADFAVMGDDRVAFTAPDATGPALRAAGIWPPGEGEPGPGRRAVPLRRLVARR